MRITRVKPNVEPMKLQTLRRTSLVAALFLGLSVYLASCDAVQVGGFELPERRVTLDFVFQGNELDTASLNTVLSNNQVDLTGYIQQRGFSPSDVIGARIRSGSAELRVARPLTAGIGHFAEVQVRARQGGSTGALLVSGTGFSGNADTAPLSIASVNLGSVVANGAFGGELRVQPVAGNILNQEYRLEISFDVIIEVEA